MFRPQIAVIGSGKINDGEPIFVIAQELGKRLVDEGYIVISGGLGGVMEAVSKGAKSSLSYKDGMTVGILPSLDSNTANEYIDVRIATGLSFARNQVIIASADVVVSISGGAGTLSEIAFAWQLRKPIIAFSTTGGWSEELGGRKLDDTREDEILIANNVVDVMSYIAEILQNKNSN